jgi:alpha-1,2-glucosyltransferase
MSRKPNGIAMAIIRGIQRSRRRPACMRTLFAFEKEELLTNRRRYLAAKLFQPLIGCEINALRLLNVMALSLICPLSYAIIRTIRSRNLSGYSSAKRIESNAATLGGDDSTVLLDAHTALNVTLFPPLFFFAALFYTDVISTLVVLLSYGALLQKNTIIGTFLGNITAVVIGITALMFRQTNVFWVAIFPAGLAVIDALKRSAHLSKSVGEKTFKSTIQSCWNDGSVYDCSVQDALLEGTCMIYSPVTLF